MVSTKDKFAPFLTAMGIVSLKNAAERESDGTTTPEKYNSNGRAIVAEPLNWEQTTVDLTQPYMVLLSDEPSGDWSFFEVAFFTGNSDRSIIRSDLLERSDFNSNLWDTLNDLNSDNKLDKPWLIKDLKQALLNRDTQGSGPTESSLGEFEEAMIIGYEKAFEAMEFEPFANWGEVTPPIFIEPNPLEGAMEEGFFTDEWVAANPWMGEVADLYNDMVEKMPESSREDFIKNMEDYTAADYDWEKTLQK